MSGVVISQLINWADERARVKAADWGSHAAANAARKEINKSRERVLGSMRRLDLKPTDQLNIGTAYNSRLTVTELPDGRNEISYIAGQYAPTEVWPAVENYILRHCRNTPPKTPA